MSIGENVRTQMKDIENTSNEKERAAIVWIDSDLFSIGDYIE